MLSFYLRQYKYKNLDYTNLNIQQHFLVS